MDIGAGANRDSGGPLSGDVEASAPVSCAYNDAAWLERFLADWLVRLIREREPDPDAVEREWRRGRL